MSSPLPVLLEPIAKPSHGNCLSPMHPHLKASRLLAENVRALLIAQHKNQTELAAWCEHSDPWVSQFLRGDREWQLGDLDRIADFFHIATYQLFQPGISTATERRAGLDRRRGKDRRISHETRLARDLDARLHPQPKGSDHAATAHATALRSLIAEFEHRLTRLLPQTESGRQTPTPRARKSATSPRHRNPDRSDPPTSKG